MSGDSDAQTTIVLAVWDDYVAHLDEALESLEQQDAAARLIVVDNASAAELPELPAGASLVRAPHRLTLGAARNLGLAEVATPFVVFWDADDVMLPGTLAALQGAIGADARLAAFGAAITEQPSGKRHRWPRPWVGRVVRLPRLFALLDCVWSLYPTTGATIMRTELVRAAGGYGDADSGEDWCLGVSLAARGRIGWSETPGRVYRLHGGSVWASHLTVRHLLRHARAVRARIRADPGTPGPIRIALPVIQLGQYLAIAAHVAVATARRTRRTR